MEILKHVGSPLSDVMQNLTFYGGTILVVLISFGIIWELRRCIRGTEFEFCFSHIAFPHMGVVFCFYGYIIIILHVVIAKF